MALACQNQFDAVALNSSTQPVGKGTGQGLSIAYQIIVGRHGGNIEITSEEGVGTEFQIWIPMHAPDDACDGATKTNVGQTNDATSLAAV